MTSDLAHLQRAERLLVKLRALGMASWLPILQHAGFTLPAPRVYGVFVAGLVYTGLTWQVVRSGRAVRAGAIATTLGDALIVAAICWGTGGIASDFYPYFYLTSIAISIRFGAGPALAMFAFNSALSSALFAAAPPADPAPTWGALALRVFYLSFAVLLGTALSREAADALGAARAARDRARGLLRRLIHAEEEERKRIAGELHDRMGARFFELSYGIDRARAAVGGDRPDAELHLARLGADARACGDEIRELMNELRPTVLDDFGVSEALREYGMALSAGQSELRVKLEIDPDANAARQEVNAALFRIAQEAVLNARKHAEASELEIGLARDPSAARIVLSVRDDGCGFDARAPTRGRYGLMTMRERAEACGGTLELTSAPGRGTRVRAVVPAGGEP
jgi:signal transduction histidine kinase